MRKKTTLGLFALILLVLGVGLFFVFRPQPSTDKYIEVKIRSIDDQRSHIQKQYKGKLSAKELQQLDHILQEQVAALKEVGWSERSISAAYLTFLETQPDARQLFAYLEHQFQSAQVFGSPLFQDLWNLESDFLNQKEAQRLLEYSLELVHFPQELSGDAGETARLLRYFDKDLEPDAYFWGSFARVVQTAFPKKQLSQKKLLAKQIHQFRYLISAQQAQWVREHFRGQGQTDRDALVAYLATKYNKKEVVDEFGLTDFEYFVDYDLEESSRLHNKVANLRSQSGSVVMLYPDLAPVVNIKIVMSFHTEFILDSNGHFANELDPEGVSENGLVNGASFNYANKNNGLHQTLDVKPVKPHDPAYRKKVVATPYYAFQAPNNRRFSFQPSRFENWTQSCFNHEGIFSLKGKSSFDRIKEEIARLQKDIKEVADA